MVEELLMSDSVGDGTHILIHQVPQWQLSEDITNAPALITPCSLNTRADICERGDGSSLLLNTSQQKQQEEPQQFCLEVLEDSLKMDLVVLNKDDFLQQQNLTVVNDLPLDHLVDTLMTYSCRLRVFVPTDVSQLLQHFSTSHCLTLPQVVLGAAPSLPTESSAEPEQENDKLGNMIFGST